ncbi:Clathrin adaptor complex-like protein, partial [Phytophthora palmivora]
MIPNAYGFFAKTFDWKSTTGLPPPEDQEKARLEAEIHRLVVAPNELLGLETIHLFVELLDQQFANVCELDIVFNFNK